MKPPKEITVTMILPNVDKWEDWNSFSVKEVLKQLEIDIEQNLTSDWIVDEIQLVKAEISSYDN